MPEHRVSISKKEKSDYLFEDRSGDKSQLDSSYDDLPPYKEAAQDEMVNWLDAEYHANGSAVNSAQEQDFQEQQPPCSHWSESRCRITVKSRKCCSCMDDRPETESGRYPMYVDGQGWVEKATRWQYYCPNCQEYFDPNAKARMLRDQCVWAEKRAKSLADERNQRYFGLGRWIEATKVYFSS